MVSKTSLRLRMMLPKCSLTGTHPFLKTVNCTVLLGEGLPTASTKGDLQLKCALSSDVVACEASDHLRSTQHTGELVTVRVVHLTLMMGAERRWGVMP